MDQPLEILMFYILVAIIAIPIYLHKRKKKIEKDNNKQILKEKELKIEPAEIYPYEKKYLLTKNEWFFYKALKPIADKLNYSIIAKIRLADLIEVHGNLNESEYYRYFAKIKSKHIDFALCDPHNLEPILLIELDDNSHKTPNRIERDIFVNNALTATGYKILHLRGTGELENNIKGILNKHQSEEPLKEQNKSNQTTAL